MRRRDLECVLLGVLLSTAAYAVRAAWLTYLQFEERISHIETFLTALTHAMRSAQ